MKIGFIGTRGIPGRYGGFETCVENISIRLVKMGYDITVFSRPNNYYHSTEYKCVKIQYMNEMSNHLFSNTYYSLLATKYAIKNDFDILHYFGCGNVPVILLPRLIHKKTILSLDGLEWNRKSYSLPTKAFLRMFAEYAMYLPNITVVDSKTSQRWYYMATGKQPIYIPYGTIISDEINEGILKRYDLIKNKYIVFIGRLVYEKGIHTLINAFNKLDEDLKLVIIGDFPGYSSYVDHLKSIANKKVIFLGFKYDQEYTSIRNASLFYVHPSLFDGTSISLLEAMGAGKCIISSNIQENLDVVKQTALHFHTEDVNDLYLKLKLLINNPERIKDYCKKSRDRAVKVYNWDRITKKYSKLYTSLTYT